jgi:hypothetical protein
MKEEIRRAVAFVVLAEEGGNAETTIYSYEQDRRSRMSGNPNDFFDHEAGARITGSGSRFYHYGFWHHIDLNLDGASFSGYDHGSNGHFEGVVKEGTVQLYDHGEGRYFEYALAPDVAANPA